MRIAGALWLMAATLAALAGCQGDDSDESEEARPKKEAEQAEAEETASAAEAPKDTGPSVAIVAGTLTAGSRCYDIPRVRPDELEAEEVSLGAFEIDAYPYPNEPGKPAKVGVSHEEAARLCAERGKRLCSELEWERACKGADSATYPWGGKYDGKACPSQPDHVIGARPECKSGFGMFDSAGLVWEWTASDWKRGTPNGDKVLRGAASDKVSYLDARCAFAKRGSPHKSDQEVGFRCCSGADNVAEVVLNHTKRKTVEQESDITPNFEMTLMGVLPRDHRAITGVRLSFDQVYRWHPVLGEEMLVGRWQGTPKEGGSYYEIAVFKLCDGRARLAARMRGPVAKMGKPQVAVTPNKLRFDVETGKRKGTVEISYWHGGVKLTEPDWVKKGNQLKVDDEKRPHLRIPVMKRKK